MTMPEHLRLPTTPLAPASSMITGEHHRITMLTTRLVRLEWSPSGRFEDRATQMVINRAFPTPDFRLVRDGDQLQIITDHLHLRYDGGPFTPEGLSIQQLEGGYHSIWRPGQEADSAFSAFGGMRNQLGGTVRTLDTVDGATELDPGLMNSLGITSLADEGIALTDDGWVAPREEGHQDIYVFAHGRDYAGALADFYRLTGPQPILPRHALGNWWSRYHRYTQQEYTALVERFQAERLPFSVAVVDMDWHLTEIEPRYGSGWTGYTWNRELFPDHVGFLRWLHEQGLTVSLNVHPADGVRGFEEPYARMATAMGIDPASDLPVVFDIADPDFLQAYLTEVHHPLEEQGVDFWWIDWQQGSHSRIPGLDPLWMLNHYHFLDNARTGRRPLTFSRYAGPGSHRYPVGFSGDTVTSWASLAFQPYMTATAANIGFGWWSHDIGGHMFGTRSDELATRWLQFGVFSPINRLHSSNSPFAGKEPWRFGETARRVMGEALRLRHRLVPYLFTMNELGHRELFPLLRPMYHSHPQFEEAHQVDDQYWFGTEIIVAPITTPIERGPNVAPVRTWLPDGVFVDLFTGLVYRGGRFITMHRGIDSVPALGRAGAIIPLTGPEDLRVDNPASLELRVIAGASGDFTLYEDDDAVQARAVRTRIRFDWEGGRLVIEPAEGALDVVPARRRVRVVLQGAAPVEVHGRESHWDAATGSLTIDLGEVATAEGAEVSFAGALSLHDNQVEARVLAFIDRAEIEMLTKERVMAIMRASSSSARRLAMLAELGLGETLLAALRELVTALD